MKNFEDEFLPCDLTYFKTSKKAISIEDESKSLEPWTDRTFIVNTLKEGVEKKQRSKIVSVKKRSINPTSGRTSSRTRQTCENFNPVYRIDTYQKENQAEKIKWKLEPQFCKIRKKKATIDRLKLKLSPHRFHTVDSTCKKMPMKIETNQMSIKDMYKKLQQTGLKKSSSDRLRKPLKCQNVQSMTYNNVKYGEEKLLHYGCIRLDKNKLNGIKGCRNSLPFQTQKKTLQQDNSLKKVSIRYSEKDRHKKGELIHKLMDNWSNNCEIKKIYQKKKYRKI